MSTTGRTGGFSLIEVMCAILVFGVSIVGLTRGIATALRSNKESEVQTTAALIAAGQIETLRAEGFLLEGEDEGDFGEMLAQYRWKQSVSSTGIDGLFEVTVFVENAETGTTIYELKTLLFEAPITDQALDEEGTGRGQSRSGQRRRSR